MRLLVNEETRGNQEQKGAVPCLAESAGRLKVRKERKEMERDGSEERGKRERERERERERKGQ
jgi:hypothetical protein